MLSENAVNGALPEEHKALSFPISEFQSQRLKKHAKEKGRSLTVYATERIADAVAGYEKSNSYHVSVDLMDLRSRINENFFIVWQFCKSSHADSAAYERAKEAAGDYAVCMSSIERITDTICSWFRNFV